MCKAITSGLWKLPFAMLTAQGFLYGQQPFCQPFNGAPQLRILVPGGEAELNQIPFQEQQQRIWGPVPACPLGVCLPAQQGTYFGQAVVIGTPECLNRLPAPALPPTISNGTHLAPPVVERPVLRFLIRPRRPIAGRTT